MIGSFDYFVGIDWSGAKGTVQKGLSVAFCDQAGLCMQLPPPHHPHWSRPAILHWIEAPSLKGRLFIGIDSAFACPFVDKAAYFPGYHMPDAPKSAQNLWSVLSRCCDASFYPDQFLVQFSQWFKQQGQPAGANYTRRLRLCEQVSNVQYKGVRAESVYNLVGASQVGKSALSTMVMLHHLRDIPGVAIWPFDSLAAVAEANIVVVELFASIFREHAGYRRKVTGWHDLQAVLSGLGGYCKIEEKEPGDHLADALMMAAGLRHLFPTQNYWQPQQLSPTVAETEGWIFGIE